MTPQKIYGQHDQRVIDQLERCMTEDSIGVLCADAHLGYSMPIGGVIAYRDYVSPSGVGFDIGCGNKAVQTNLSLEDVGDVSGIMDEIQRRIAFGMGRSAVSQIEGHPVLDLIRNAHVPQQRELYDLAARQLGTVGAGNHYVDLFVDEDDTIWIGVHFGSRGFGHKTASGFLALAQGLDWGEKYSEGSMDAAPTLIEANSVLGQEYLAAMMLAGQYAYAGRDVVCDEVLDILGADAEYEVHNHHNYTWCEEHNGEKFWVVRKGATPALPHQEGFVGGSMGDQSVILEGIRNEQNAQGLYSTVHGAGRAMSRREAAGKVRRRKRWKCAERGCNRMFDIDGVSAYNAHPKKGLCPDHPWARAKKIWVSEVKSPGKIDWKATKAQLASQGIELRGGAADEAPLAYKRLPEVLAEHEGTIHIKNYLTPIGVAMAGDDIVDPYKD